MASMKSLFVVAVFLYVGNSLDANTDSTCSRSYRLQTGRSGYITSPGYPDNYSELLWCRWKIVPPVNTKVEILFETFSLEPPNIGGNCVDYIAIGGIGYCGSTAPSTQYYTGDVLIEFISDNSVNYMYKGFKLIWRILKVDSTCSKKPRVQDDTSGYITSPKYPDKYSEHLDCKWRIETPKNKLVEISFDKNFHIKESTDVNYKGVCWDKLTIGSEIGSNQYCGWTAPGKRLYTGNITIQFTSDSNRNYVGFKLYWRFVRGSVWQVIVFTGRSTGIIIQTVRIGFGETGSDITYFHLGTEFEAGSNKTHELLLPVNITNPHPPRKLMLKSARNTNWRVIQVALVGVIDGDNVVYMYNCSKSHTKTQTCNYHSEIHKPVKWQIAVFSGIKWNSSRLYYTSGRVDIQIIGDRNESQFTYLGSQFGKIRERKDVIIFTRNIGKPKTVKIKRESGNREKWWLLKQFTMFSSKIFPNQQFVANTTKTMSNSTTSTHIGSNQVAVIELKTVEFGPSAVTQVTETTSTSRPSTVTQVTITTSTSNSKNAGPADTVAGFWATVGSAIGFSIVIAIVIVVTVVLYVHRRNMYNRNNTGVVSEPDVVYECSVGASARIDRRTVPPSTPAAPSAAGVGFIEEVENVEDDDFTAGSVDIEDIGEDGTIYARLDNMSRPDPARLQPSTSRGRTAPRVILGAEEDVGLYGELDFSRPAIPLTELNNR
ncbi:uncharacterized protein LOC141909754 isoform X2 [Tubulanus polymorphus]|uniref:uncharacterized protein LOC141909754 isoform X2 n=1 Tax=Tubulanus polymorphus TaxID=672921 RepID=UPI003DA4A835